MRSFSLPLQAYLIPRRRAKHAVSKEARGGSNEIGIS